MLVDIVKHINVLIGFFTNTEMEDINNQISDSLEWMAWLIGFNTNFILQINEKKCLQKNTEGYCPAFSKHPIQKNNQFDAAYAYAITTEVAGRTFCFSINDESNS